MIRISKLTDYAMLILSYMAKQPERTMSAPLLADALHLSLPTVSKILKMLSDANLVDSIRGAEGGYHLAKTAAKITVSDVIAAMEGALALTECCDKTSLCALDSMCALRENWRKINRMVQSLLGRLTILDMIEPISFDQLLRVQSNDK